jgi:DNA-directed RNA polymerase specialized sigma24 family protein
MDTVPSRGASPVSSSDLLAALGGDTATFSTIYKESLTHLTRQARRRAPSLSPDLHEEIVQETWQLAFARGQTTFKASGVEPGAYLAGVLRNAAEVVWSDNRPVGTRSRSKRDTLRWENDDIDAQGADDLQSADQFADHDRATTMRLDVQRFCKSAERPVADAVQLMLREGLSLTEASVAVGMSRQTLRRRLEGLRSAA